MKKREVLIGILVIGLFTVSPSAQDAVERSSDGALDGTWAATWSSEPGGPPPFRGLVALHADGILAETSSSLHANSLGVSLPFNASDGYGTWVPRPDRRKSGYTFYKMLFGEDGLLAGYLRVTGSLEIDAGNRNHIAGRCTVDFVFGPDPTGPVGQALGSCFIEATRLRVLSVRR
jgi:hypothetical protein